MPIKAIIFDLDGVIVSTDEFHYQAWKKLADKLGIYFDRKINDRLRGVSRMDSLEILLERSEIKFGSDEKFMMADIKNGIYRDLLAYLTPQDVLPGVGLILEGLKRKSVRTAIASSSKNARLILEKTGLQDSFDAIVDGNCISESKPSPEVFLKAASRLGIPSEECLVVEDAESGVCAAVAGGMWVLAVGSASGDARADLSASGLDRLTADDLLSVDKLSMDNRGDGSCSTIGTAG